MGPTVGGWKDTDETPAGGAVPSVLAGETSLTTRDYVNVTVRHVLQLPEVQAGKPTVFTGEAGLDNPVRWVHVSELPDIAKLLRGGELILTTGIALPHADEDLERYVDDLRSADISGLVIELGRRFDLLPPKLVDVAQRHGIPLIALQNETPFVRITEAVHELILGQQLDVLRVSDHMHRSFTDMSMDGATAQQIVSHVASLSGGAVVLENLVHQILSVEAGGQLIESVIGDWEHCSRRLRNRERTEVIPRPQDREVWVVTDVSARGEKWGRLLMRLTSSPTPVQIEAVERGATALAINRLVERNRETLERQSHRTLLNDIWTGSYSSTAAVVLHGHNLGVPLTGRVLIGALVYMAPDEAGGLWVHESRDRDTTETVAEAARIVGIPALVGVLRTGHVGVALSLPDGADTGALLNAFSKEIHRSVLQVTPTPLTRIGVGSAVDTVNELRRSLAEAEQIVEASVGMPDDKLYFALPDIRIHGLLYLLRDDPRLQLFIERELGPLLLHDDARGSDLADVLRVFLRHGGNKSTAAAELRMSRPSLYHRLEHIESILGISFEDIDSRTSLHVALLGLDVVRSSEP